MDRLWTPWRFDYINKIDPSSGHCVFCEILSQNRDEDNFVLCRKGSVFVILNLFPYTSGHILVVARRHIAALQDATPDELHEFLETAQTCERALRKEYQPEGFNIGINIGRTAGAGVDRHLHMHVLPRWTGDANFLSAVAETRVLPEVIPQTYQRLLPYFQTAP
jgi:ATP adenylyltransferase